MAAATRQDATRVTKNHTFPRLCENPVNQTDESESRRGRAIYFGHLWRHGSALRELLKSPFFIVYVCISSAGWAYAYSFAISLRAPYTALSSEQCSHCLTTDISSKTSETDINISVDEVHFPHLLDTDISFLGSS